MKLKMCVGKFLGNCPKCEVDFNPNHHPNNEDCPGFIPMTVHIIEAKEEKDESSTPGGE